MRYFPARLTAAWPICFVIAALLVPLLLTTPVAAQDDPRAETIAVITAPTEASQVSGQVQITGSASHPTLFAGYELEFDNLADTNEVWIPIGQRVNQQITDGVLGIWDTVADRVADGRYRIRLRVFLSGDLEPVSFVVNDVQVTNTVPTALPTTRPEGPTPTQLQPPTAGPSPTSLVVQPPTNTPQSTIERLAGSEPSAPSGREGSFSLNFGQLQSSFCTGVYIAFGGFMLFGGYLWLRARLRPTARQVWWQIRSEFDQDE